MWFSVSLMSAVVAKNEYLPIQGILAKRSSLSRKMSAPEVARAKLLATRCYLSDFKRCGS